MANLRMVLFCAIGAGNRYLADAHPRVNKWTREARAGLCRQNNPGDSKWFEPSKALLIRGAIEMLGSIGALPPGNSGLRKVAGDAAVFVPIGDRASFRAGPKALCILSGAFNVVVIECEDRVAGRVGSNPKKGLLPAIAWRQSRPLHMVGLGVSEPLAGKERARDQETKRGDRSRSKFGQQSSREKHAGDIDKLECAQHLEPGQQQAAAAVHEKQRYQQRATAHQGSSDGERTRAPRGVLVRACDPQQQ